MTRSIMLVCAMSILVMAHAKTFSYNFNSTPLPEAIRQIMKEHPALDVNFIYNELENYNTNATVSSDNAYEALRQTIGFNPVTVVKAKDTYYVEAFQHGKYRFKGRVVDTEGVPLVGATVMLLTPKDSTVVTYGVTADDGAFLIPSDKKNVMAKIVCMGYIKTYRECDGYDLGTITLLEQPIALQNVVVESPNTVLAPDKNTYLPTHRQKQFSQTGIDLLRHMAVPSLVIVPGSDAVTDVYGTICELFINYMPASDEDVKGMKITDVRRVEIYDFPSDPRFRGVRKAVNFVVQEYTYGGYTKLMASGTALNGFTGRSDIFSKFTYKKMTYDFYAGAYNNVNHHVGADATSRYSLTDGIVTRNGHITNSKSVTNSYPVSFRASFVSPRLQIRNLVSLTMDATPEKSHSGQFDYDSQPDRDYTYYRNSSEMANGLNYNGSLYWIHPRDFAVDYSHSIAYTHRNSSSAYLNHAVGFPIDNNAEENVTQLKFNLYGLKAFGPRHRLMAGGRVIYLNDNVNYTGSSFLMSHMKTLAAMGSIDYTYSTRRLYLMARLGGGSEHMTIDGQTYNETALYGKVECSYMLNDRNRLSAYVALDNFTPDIDMRQDAVIRNDEFIYLTGNPKLGNYKQLSTNLSYNLVPLPKLSLAFFGGYNETFNRVATIYTPYDGALLRSFLNDGNYINAYFGISCNLKLLNNNLQLYGNMAQNTYKTTGLYDTTYHPVIRLQLQASYYWKSFYGLIAWSNKNGSLTENSNIIIKNSQSYVIEAGWGNGKWNISLRANNIFNTEWVSQKWQRTTPLYNEWQTYYSPDSHASLCLSAAYTIGYGKKVRQGNEIGAQKAGASAILKP